ncbi:lysophospholipid acyltransferase family protein [Saccharopolyspora halophila]
MRINRAVIGLTGRLEVTGDVPTESEGPMLMVANHIGNIDPLVLVAACHERRIAPRFVATGGLFNTPVLGAVMRNAGHVRADRGKATAAEALGYAVASLTEDSRPLIVYPEGRITLEPDMWPERGKTGAARMALASGAQVVPISQWGAHETMCYGMVRVRTARDLWILFSSWLRAVRRRPVLRVHFGAPVDLTDLSPERVGDAARARDRMMRAVTEGLADLRVGELGHPHHRDPTRPATTKRSPYRA